MKKDLITLLVLAYLVLTFLVPVLRHRILFGRWPLVFHLESDPLQRLMGGLLGILVSAWAVWACLNWMLPPDRLGVWRTPAWLDWVGLCFVLGGASLQFAGQSTMGTKKTGSLLRSSSVKVRSWRMVNRIGFLQQAHSDSISNERGSSLSFPCTKGAATASVPQAAQSLSPLEKASLWEVGSAVIG